VTARKPRAATVETEPKTTSGLLGLLDNERRSYFMPAFRYADEHALAILGAGGAFGHFETIGVGASGVIETIAKMLGGSEDVYDELERTVSEKVYEGVMAREVGLGHAAYLVGFAVGMRLAEGAR
jgi:hypothetical protein